MDYSINGIEHQIEDEAGLETNKIYELICIFGLAWLVSSCAEAPANLVTAEPTNTPISSPSTVPPTETAMPVSRDTPTEGKIVFESIQESQEIFIVNTDGSNLTRITNNADIDVFPVGSPDGNFIAFMHSPAGDEPYEAMDIWIMDSDGCNIETVTNVFGGEEYPNWSPNSNQLAFGCETWRKDICVINADGSQSSQLTADENSTYQMTFTSLSSARHWSPDGSMIVFSEYSDGIWGIARTNKDGSGYARLTNDFLSIEPTWSPDGSRIAFIRAEPQGCEENCNFEIYVMDPDGSVLTNLTNDPAEDNNPVWSPDGRSLAFVSNRDGNYELYVLDLESDRIVRLTDSPGFDGQPSWSPDGSRLAFTSEREKNIDIYVVDISGENIIRLTTDEADDYNPYWLSVMDEQPEDSQLTRPPAEQECKPWEAWPTATPEPPKTPEPTAPPPLGSKLLPPPAHSIPGHWYALAVSPNSKQIAVSGDEGIEIFDATTLDRIHYFDQFDLGYITEIVFSPDGKKLAFIHSPFFEDLPDSLTVLDIDTPQTTLLGIEPDEPSAFTIYLEYSPDGRFLVWGIWSYENEDILRFFDSESGALLENQPDIPALNIHSGAFSSDGKLLGICCSGEAIILWGLQENSVVGEIPDAGKIGDLFFTPDGKSLMGRDWESQQIYSWDLRTLNPNQLPDDFAFNPIEYDYGDFSFSPDGRFMSACYVGLGDIGEYAFVVFDAQTGEPIVSTVTPHCLSSAFTSDGKMLVLLTSSDLQVYEMNAIMK